MPRKKQDTPSRRLRVQVKLYDADNNLIASEGDELEEGILDRATTEWLLRDGLGEWVEGE